MPSLICCSPTILDQSFPRDIYELNRVLITFGELQQLIEEDKINIVITETLKDFVLDFNWTNNQLPIIYELYNLLNQWLLQSHKKLIEIDTGIIDDYSKHPIPNSVVNSGLVDMWSDEVGRILAIHDNLVSPRYCIGIACENAFSGLPLSHYNIQVKRCFPLIGPHNLNIISDSYFWEIPKNLSNQLVTFNDAYKNINLLGATEIEKPKGSSHYMVKFPQNRSWPLDINHDHISDRILKELMPITNLPLNVIKYILLNGNLPRYISYFKTK